MSRVIVKPRSKKKCHWLDDGLIYRVAACFGLTKVSYRKKKEKRFWNICKREKASCEMLAELEASCEITKHEHVSLGRFMHLSVKQVRNSRHY